jgi:hypothetical protein
LIADRQYDEAIRLLTEHTGDESDQFFQVQKRLRRIMRLRNEYNTLAGELLEVLTTDRDNSEKILELTRQLEAVEPSRGTVRRFIAQVEEMALFGYNRQLLERIMVEARSLIDRGDYVAAMRRYASGLELYHDEFFARGYGEPVDGQVRSALEILEKNIGDFSVLVAPFNNAIAAIDQASLTGEEPGPALLQDCHARLAPLIERLIAVNNSVADAGNYFEEQLARFRQQDPDMGDRNYLAFASRVVRGRVDADIQEGLLGAVAGLWVSVLSRFDAVLETAADSAFRNACIARENRDFPLAREQFETVIAYCALATSLEDDWRRFYRGQNFPVYNYFDHALVVFKAEEYLKYYSLNLASASYIEIGSLMEQYDRLASVNSTALESWQQGRMDARTALALEARTRGGYRDLAAKVGAMLGRLNRDGAALSEYRRALSGERSLFVPMENALVLVADLDADVFVLENASAIRGYAIANGDLERRSAEWTGLFAEANRFFTGESDDDGRVAKRPREALVLFEQINRGSARWQEEESALIARYEAESPRFFREPRIAALYNNALAMGRELGELRTTTLALEQTSRTQAAQAAALEADGDRLCQEAESALARSDFDTARTRALLAGERYDSSLAIQESAPVRIARDVSLIALGAEITRLEHEAVVREVRSLVNTAMDTYFDGDFARAEESLVRAMNRWRSANIEDDPEVTYWLTLVRGAMSLRAGRVILPTAPLYAEMSQLLSAAGKNYSEGMALIAENRREDGVALFAEARRKTREVRLMFPVNQEASLLELRMDQVMDPAAFNASFQRRLNEAVSGTRQGSVESFADLQNLFQLNPDYPGIRGMVVQAEIDIGYRPAPPDPRSLARSGELAATARGIVDRNLRSQFPVALELLNQALALNPSNSQAMSLKDRVQTEMGGGASVVLSSAAEQEYQRAVQALQQGNTLVAMNIVRQLLLDEKNRDSKRILDLQKRIESIL